MRAGALRGRGGDQALSTSNNRTQLCTFPEGIRYERLVELEGRRVHVEYGRTTQTFAEVTGELVCVAYPLDTAKTDPPSVVILRDDEDCWRTVKSSSIRQIKELEF